MPSLLNRPRWLWPLAVWLLSLLFVATTDAAPHFEYLHKIWRAEEGLPNPVIRAIMQSKAGYLWLATDEGLVRFDGVQFKEMEHKTTTDKVERWVVGLCETKDGSIWVSSANGGLLRFKEGQSWRYTTNNGLPSNNVLSALQDAKGNLWIGTAGGLCRFAEERFTCYTNQPGLIPESVRALAEAPDGKVWIGTAKGLSYYADGKFFTSTNRNMVVDESVMALCAARDGALWVGTRAGLTRISDGESTHYTTADGLAHATVRAVYEDRQDRIWLGTQGGLQQFVDDKIINVPFRTLTEDFEGVMFVYSLCEDREGNLWVGTNLGLNRLQPPKFKSITRDEGLPHNLATLVYQDEDETLWIGTYGGGLCQVHGGEITTWSARDNGLTSNYILALAHDRDETLWIGTDGTGLNRVKDGVFTQYLMPDNPAANTVRVICPDSRGNLWFGHNGGVSCITNGQVVLETNLTRTIVKAIIEDKHTNMWFAARSGLLCWRAEGQIQAFKKTSGLCADAVNALYEDADGVLWVGTEAGLNRMQGYGKFTSFVTPEGPFREHILHILEDDYGRLWLSTRNGVFVAWKKDLTDYSRGSITSVTFASFGKRDGMRRAQCNGIAQPAGWKAKDGRLWFPTMHGVVVFDPKEIATNRLPPPVLIEDVTVDGIAHNAVAEVDLKPGDGQVEFHYAAMSFQAPERVHFKYILEGVDRDWQDAGTRRFASYVHLGPGTYTFRVTACNNDGVWSETPATMTLTLQPHFYQTSAFYGIWILAAALGAFGVHRFRIRVHEQREKELSKLVEQRTEKLQELVKSMESFNYSIAHDLRAPIRAIRGFTQALVEDYRSNFDEMACEYAKRIQMSVDRMDQLIQDLLIYGQLSHKEIPLERLNSEEILNRVLDTFSPEIQAKGAKIDVQRPLPKVWGNPTILQQIFANFVSNGMKFVPAKTTPNIKIWCEEKNGHVKFCVRDNGIGIKPQHHDRIFRIFERLHSAEVYPGTGIGLAIVKRGAERMGGKVGVESKHGEGSCFWVELPRESKALTSFPENYG